MTSAGASQSKKLERDATAQLGKLGTHHERKKENELVL